MTSVAAPKVLIAHGLDEADAQPRFTQLPNPRTGLTSQYIITNSSLQEIQWFKQQHSSWFINDDVVQVQLTKSILNNYTDGGLYMATPVDVLYFILPMLEKAGEMFCDLEQILTNAGTVDHRVSSQLASLAAAHMACICDAKEAGGQYYYRLNKDRALEWLKLKVDATKKAFKALPGGAFAAMEDVALTVYAAGMINEYISSDWEEKLKKKLNLPEEAAAVLPMHHGGMTEPRESTEVKRPRLDPKEAAKLKAQEARQATKAAKLAKEAAGMRKLSSFFGGKPKAKS